MTRQELFTRAVQFHQTQRLTEAEALYRQILALTPDDPAAHLNLGDIYCKTYRWEEALAAFRRALDADPNLAETHYNMGNVLCQRGELDMAVPCFARAMELRGDYVEAANNLGMTLARLGRRPQAILAYTWALHLRPDDPTIHNNLGILLKEQNETKGAVAAFRRVVELRPDYAEAHYNLGNALSQNGAGEEAVVAYRRALAIQPDLAEAENNLGYLLNELGRIDEAIATLGAVLLQKPDYAEAHNNLGNALWNRDRREEAMASYREAIRRQPDYIPAHNNLGNALREEGRLDEAAAIFEQILTFAPDDADACNNLGNVRKEQGRLDEAIAGYRRAVSKKPDWAQVRSNVVFAMHLRAGGDEEIAEEQQRWNRQFVEPLYEPVLRHGNRRELERRLRIGYVSPDFRSHAVAFFLAPLLKAHDHAACEIHCYSDVRLPDAVTARLRAAADVWHDVRLLSDAELAKRVRVDGIDILVDLAMHTANNRLLAFARKPAPVQVSWLAYPGTTGVETMDYRLTDACIDPPGEQTEATEEEALRLPDSWCCYAPVEVFPEVNSLPALQSGMVMLGSLNQFCKIDEAQLHCWGRLLAGLPQSRLLMICPEGETRDRVRAVFAGHGIGNERVELIARCHWPDYTRLFQRIDVALDSYPCNGMTTTCHALWMGVPVISRSGSRSASRAGRSLLGAVGLPELVAESEEEFIRIAREWVGDLPRLAELRSVLRERMRASPLMDAPRFARHVEAAYRTMWRRWCERT